jgi:hypothetical protein
MTEPMQAHTLANGSVFDADLSLVHVESPVRRAMRKAAAVSGLVVCAAYLVYRGLYTLNPDALAFSVAVYLAEVHGFFSLAFYYFQIWEVRRRTVPPAPPGLSVDVFITTCNEDVDLLRQTVRGALNMRYPHRTVVDRLADALYNLAVPEIFARLTRPPRVVRTTHAVLSRLSGSTRFRAPRCEAYLPMRVQTRDGEEWLATTRDLSQGGLSLVSARAVEADRVVRLILRSPEGEWSSVATGVRNTPIPGADQSLRTWLPGVRVDGQADLIELRHMLSAESLV